MIDPTTGMRVLFEDSCKNTAPAYNYVLFLRNLGDGIVFDEKQNARS